MGGLYAALASFLVAASNLGGLLAGDRLYGGLNSPIGLCLDLGEVGRLRVEGY